LLELAWKQEDGKKAIRAFNIADLAQQIVDGKLVVPTVFDATAEELRLRKIMGDRCFTPYNWALLGTTRRENPLPISPGALEVILNEVCPVSVRLAEQEEAEHHQRLFQDEDGNPLRVKDTHFLFAVPEALSFVQISEAVCEPGGVRVYDHSGMHPDIVPDASAMRTSTRYSWYLMYIGCEQKIPKFVDYPLPLYETPLFCEMALLLLLRYIVTGSCITAHDYYCRCADKVKGDGKVVCTHISSNMRGTTLEVAQGCADSDYGQASEERSGVLAMRKLIV